MAAVALLSAGGVLLQSAGCASFLGRSSLMTTNFCFIFDCQNGALGGVVDFCSGMGSGDSTIESGNSNSFFTDCPQ